MAAFPYSGIFDAVGDAFSGSSDPPAQQDPSDAWEDVKEKINIPDRREEYLSILAAILGNKIAPGSDFSQAALDNYLDLHNKEYDSPLDSMFGTDSSQTSAGSSFSDIKDSLPSYLQSLITSQGKENQLNRDFNSAESALNRDFQSLEAKIQRDWYEEMSGSAYQRAMADMKAAGLNPILAYSQGGAASSGTGVAAGSAAMYNTTGGDTISSLLSSAAEFISSLNGSSASKYARAFSMMKFLLR